MQSTLGYVTLWPIGETVTFAQGVAACAMFLIYKRDVKTRSVAASAGIFA